MTKKKSETQNEKEFIIQIGKNLYKTPKGINEFNKFDLPWNDSDSNTENVKISQFTKTIDKNRYHLNLIIPGFKRSLMFYNEIIDSFENNSREKHERCLEWIGTGSTLRSEGRYKEALAAFEKVVELDPNEASYYYNRASALALLRRKKEAFNSLKKAFKLDQDLKQTAREDEYFKYYWTDPEFIKITD